MLPKQLPPTAVPITARDLRAGLNASLTSPYRFRAALAGYFDRPVDGCRLASSGRTALYCLLIGLKRLHSQRTQVIMPAYTCPVLPEVVLDAGLQPVLVDLTPGDMIYVKDELASALSKKTLAVLLVHPFGIPLAPEEIIEAAHSVGALVIEDAAQSMGASWKGQLVGTIADFGLFSLGPGKPISTAGGGIAIANKARYTSEMDAWWNELAPAKGIKSAVAWFRQIAFRAAFQPQGWWLASRLGLHRAGDQESGRRYHLTGLSPSQAAVGLSLLPRLAEINAQRARQAQAMVTSIAASSWATNIAVDKNATSAYLRLPLLANSPETRELLYSQLWHAGIGVGRLYQKSLPGYFPQLAGKAYPGAEFIASRLLTLPTHHYLTETDRGRIHDILAAA